MENIEEQNEKWFFPPNHKAQGMERDYKKDCVMYERFFNLSIDMLCIASPEGYFKLINPAFNQLGYKAEELLSKKYIEFIHPDDIASTHLEMDKLSLGVPTINFENRFRCKDGSYRWLSWTSMPDKATVMHYAVARDVTTQKINESRIQKQDEELRQQNQVLNKAVQARDEIMGFISHELKNSLTSFKITVQLVQKLLPQQDKSEVIKKSLTQLDFSIQKMSQLIQDILEITKLEAGVLKIEPRTVNLAELISEAIATQDVFAQEKRIVIKTNIPPECLKVFCDPTRTVQILMNLINNAIKFTNTDGAINISAQRIDSQVEIQVKDTGVGINQEHLPYVFNRFWQAKETAYRGTGLGLSIVKKLTEAQGGNVWVESQIGAGSSFFFTLPASRSELH